MVTLELHIVRMGDIIRTSIPQHVVFVKDSQSSFQGRRNDSRWACVVSFFFCLDALRLITNGVTVSDSDTCLPYSGCVLSFCSESWDSSTTWSYVSCRGLAVLRTSDDRSLYEVPSSLGRRSRDVQFAVGFLAVHDARRSMLVLSLTCPSWVVQFRI